MLGSNVPVPLSERVALLNRLRRETQQAREDDGLLRFVHWFLDDPWTRTISPLAKLTVRDWICQQLAEGERGYREADAAFPGHPLLARDSNGTIAGTRECPRK